MSGIVVRKIVTNGLVLCLDAANPKSIISGSTVWTDITKNNNNGILTNGPLYNSSSGGNILFDGIDDYVTTNYITNSTAFSYCVWGKSSYGGYPNRIMGNADSLAGLNGASLMWGPTSINKIWFVRRNGGNNTDRDIITNDIPNFTGNWHYIVATYDSINGSKLYCDNILVGSNTTTGFSSSLKLNIGKDGNATDAFKGNVSNVQIYNRALSVSEISQNYNALKGRFNL